MPLGWQPQRSVTGRFQVAGRVRPGHVRTVPRGRLSRQCNGPVTTENRGVMQVRYEAMRALCRVSRVMVQADLGSVTQDFAASPTLAQHQAVR